MLFSRQARTADGGGHCFFRRQKETVALLMMLSCPFLVNNLEFKIRLKAKIKLYTTLITYDNEKKQLSHTHTHVPAFS